MILYLWLSTGGIGLENGSTISYVIFTILAMFTVVFSSVNVKLSTNNLAVSILTMCFLFYSLPFSSNFNEAIGKFDGMVLPSVFIFLILSSISKYDNNFSETFISVGLTILVITVFFKIYTGFWIRHERYFLNGSIVFGWLMGFMAVLSIIHYCKVDNKKYLLYWIIFSLAVIWSFSKGPVLSLVLTSMIVIIGNRRLQLIGSLIFTFCLITLVLARLDIAIPNSRLFAILRFVSGETGQSDVGSLSNRLSQWTHAIELMKDNPFIGVGVGNYKLTLPGYVSPYPHNIILELLSEHGILISALICFIFAASVYPFQWEYVALFFFLLICMSFSGDAAYWRFLLFLIFAKKLKLIQR